MREIRQFGTYLLDIEGRRLERSDGEVVALGAKAFDALAFLVEHAGEPVPRKALMDALWPNTVVEENNLTQAISALRRALGDGYIATLPGRGYQFVAEVSRSRNGATAQRRDSAPHEPNDPAGTKATLGRRRLGPAAAATITVVLLAAAGYAWMASNDENDNLAPAAAAIPPIQEEGDPRAAEAAMPSIAVLPFANVSDDPALDWFAEGLAIELRNRLDRLEGLVVSGQTSSFAFKDRNLDLQTIGEALNVETVLAGTVRRSGNRLRISVELVDVADGFTLWSSPGYDRELGDVLAIQDEIAPVISELSPALGIDWTYSGTQSVDAYIHFLHGIREAGRVGPAALTEAADAFRAAVRTDRGYGEAWAELGVVLSQLAIYLPDRAAELLHEREATAQRAREVAPDLPLTQAVVGWIAYDQRDWETSLAGCDTIFAASDPKAHQLCAGALTGLGFVKQALRYRKAAADADPLSLAVSLTLARHYALLGLVDDTKAEYERGQQFPGASWGREEPLLYSLMHEGIAPEQLAMRLEPICTGVPAVDYFCPVLSEALRNPEEASQILRALLESMRSTAPQNSYIVALFAAYLGETELALDALETFARRAAPATYQHLWYPSLSEARSTDRFKDLMQEIGFAHWWRQSGRWNDYCTPVDRDDFECV